MIVPPLGILSAMGLLWGVAFHWVDLALLAGFYVLCAFGTTIGFHRYFTHRDPRPASRSRALLAILGCMAMQGPLTQWVTDHRKHHALSDRPATRTRRTSAAATAWGAVRGFVHAHVGWLFSTWAWSRAAKYGQRTSTTTRLVRAIDRLVRLWVVVTLGLPFPIGYAIGGSAGAGWRRWSGAA